MNIPLKKDNIYNTYYLNYNLFFNNLLFIILSLNKITAIKGKPYNINTFTGNKDGIFKSCKKVIISKKITFNIISLGNKVSNKTRVITALI